MTEIVNLVGASIAWFTPMAMVRVYENAYGLSYTGVNTASLTMTFLFIPLLSFLYMIMPYPKTIGTMSNLAGLLGMLGFFTSP